MRLHLWIAVITALVFSLAPAKAQFWELYVPPEEGADLTRSTAFVRSDQSIFLVGIDGQTASWQAGFYVLTLAAPVDVELTIIGAKNDRISRLLGPDEYVLDHVSETVDAIKFPVSEIELDALVSGHMVITRAGDQRFSFSLLGSHEIENLREMLGPHILAMQEDVEHDPEQEKTDCMQAAMDGTVMVEDCLEVLDIPSVDPARVDAFIEAVSLNECRLSQAARENYLPNVGFRDPVEVEGITARLFYFDMARLQPSQTGGAPVLEIIGGPCPMPAGRPSTKELFLAEIAAQNRCTLPTAEIGATAQRIGVMRQEIDLMLPFLRNTGDLVLWHDDEKITLVDELCASLNGIERRYAQEERVNESAALEEGNAGAKAGDASLRLGPSNVGAIATVMPQSGSSAIGSVEGSQINAQLPRDKLLGPAEAPVLPCDQLAAHARDAYAVAEGVAFDEIQTGAAIASCKEAVKQHPNTARFYFQLGRAYDAANDHITAYRTYLKAADFDYPIAFANLAYLFEEGQGVAKDMRRAALMQRDAAVLEHLPSMLKIAEFYEKGIGVHQNYERALFWYTEAANRGNVRAMSMLGHYHWNAKGTVSDMPKARKWLERASERGNATAAFNLAIFFDEETHAIKRDPEVSARYLLLAIERGSKAAFKAMADRSQSWREDTRRAVQSQLRQRGLYDGGIDGKIGPMTVQALEILRDG